MIRPSLHVLRYTLAFLGALCALILAGQAFALLDAIVAGGGR